MGTLVLSVFRLLVCCGSYDTVVVVSATAVDESRLAIDAKAVLRVVFYGANAKLLSLAVNDLAIL